jgi:tetratricopeptide (TPR) repeat protein
MNELHGNVGQAVQASHIDSVNIDAVHPVAVPLTALDGLAPPSPLFVGRDAELETLARTQFAVVSGLAGAGKTELVLHHAHSQEFPGGRLFCNFHGYDKSRRITASDALDSFLRSLGVADIPPAEADKAALFRSLVAARERMLIVLDNVHTAAQVRPLVVAGHQVIVTSRHRLTSLDGATSLDLGVLDAGAATELVGDAELARSCGRLPLALAIMRALRASDPDNDWAAELRTTRLGLLVDDDRDVRAAFDLSYQALSREQQRFFRLLALHPGDEVVLEGAAALAKVDLMTAKRLLRELRTASLLDRRNRFHDLIRDYALECVAKESKDVRTEAEDRLVRHFGEQAVSALIDPTSDNVAWLNTHVEVLVATVNMTHRPGREAETLVLAWVLADLARVRSAVQMSSGLAAAAVTNWTEAVRHARELIDRARSEGNADQFIDFERAMANFLIRFADADLIARMTSGRDSAAASHDWERAGAFSMLLGSTQVLVGHLDKAISNFHYALDAADKSQLMDEHIASVHYSLAVALRLAERHDEALIHLQKALAINESLQNANLQGRLLIMLGETRHEAGDVEQARRHWEEAVPLLHGAGSEIELATVKLLLSKTS